MDIDAEQGQDLSREEVFIVSAACSTATAYELVPGDERRVVIESGAQIEATCMAELMLQFRDTSRNHLSELCCSPTV